MGSFDALCCIIECNRINDDFHEEKERAEPLLMPES